MELGTGRAREGKVAPATGAKRGTTSSSRKSQRIVGEIKEAKEELKSMFSVRSRDEDDEFQVEQATKELTKLKSLFIPSGESDGPRDGAGKVGARKRSNKIAPDR